MKKKILASILCFCVVMGVIGAPMVSFAASPSPMLEEVEPTWVNTSSIMLNMNFRNGTMTSEGTIVGMSGTASISATFVLERLVNGQYQHVDSWSVSSNSIMLSSIRNTSGCLTGTYRLRVSATVVRGGVAERVSDSSVRTF